MEVVGIEMRPGDHIAMEWDEKSPPQLVIRDSAGRAYFAVSLRFEHFKDLQALGEWVNLYLLRRVQLLEELTK